MTNSAPQSQHAGGPLITKRLVEFRDTDAAGIVHFSGFFFWMESVEHELLRTAGVRVVDRLSSGIDASWPRVSVSCDYKSAIHFGEEVTIAIAVRSIGRTSVTYAFSFKRDEQLIAEGQVVTVRCLMHPDKKPEAVLIPQDIIDRLEPYCE